MGQTGPGRDNEGGQKVQQPNGEVEGPEGWCDWGKRNYNGKSYREESCTQGETKDNVYVAPLAWTKRTLKVYFMPLSSFNINAIMFKITKFGISLQHELELMNFCTKSPNY